MNKNTLSILASVALAASLSAESKPAEKLASRMQARSTGERLQGYRDAAIGTAQMASAMTEQEKTPQRAVTVVSTDRLIPLVLITLVTGSGMKTSPVMGKSKTASSRSSLAIATFPGCVPTVRDVRLI